MPGKPTLENCTPSDENGTGEATIGPPGRKEPVKEYGCWAYMGLETVLGGGE